MRTGASVQSEHGGSSQRGQRHRQRLPVPGGEPVYSQVTTCSQFLFCFSSHTSSCSIQVVCMKVGHTAGRSSRSSAGNSPKAASRAELCTSNIWTLHAVFIPNERGADRRRGWQMGIFYCIPDPSSFYSYSSSFVHSRVLQAAAGCLGIKEEQENTPAHIRHKTELLCVQGKRSNYRNERSNSAPTSFLVIGQ